MVDTNGGLLMVHLTTAEVQDAAGAEQIIKAVRKLAGQQSFQILPRRGLVECIFDWRMLRRRLVRGYERRLNVSDAMIHHLRHATFFRCRRVRVIPEFTLRTKFIWQPIFKSQTLLSLILIKLVRLERLF